MVSRRIPGVSAAQKCGKFFVAELPVLLCHVPAQRREQERMPMHQGVRSGDKGRSQELPRRPVRIEESPRFHRP